MSAAIIHVEVIIINGTNSASIANMQLKLQQLSGGAHINTIYVCASCLIRNEKNQKRVFPPTEPPPTLPPPQPTPIDQYPSSSRLSWLAYPPTAFDEEIGTSDVRSLDAASFACHRGPFTEYHLDAQLVGDHHMSVRVVSPIDSHCSHWRNVISSPSFSDDGPLMWFALLLVPRAGARWAIGAR